jgi:23S rRNA pseudouridine1911/1915/1917 synthase
VREGSSVEVRMNAPRPRPSRLDPDTIVHLDAHVVVVRKPAGLATVPYQDEEPDNLEQRVRDHLTRGSGRGGVAPLGVVHRIDKETSGLLVFTRTWLAKQSLSAQFRAHTVHRRYLAIARGKVASRRIESRLVADRSDGFRGSTRLPGIGQLAVTHVEALRTFAEATLVSCRLETGRTHQIRIHLSESGHPLLGERVYVRGRPEDDLPAPRLMLHAAELGFVHPATGLDLRFEAEVPADMEATLARLAAS